MNITLSAEKALIKKTREYAQSHGTTMNKMIREFMETVTGGQAGDHVAEEFAQLARDHAGISPKGFHVNRDEAHQR
ncbi:MAG: hypothetical protein EOM20_00010 [Spartobacteria bacterium]|nr:hypothetical protein [Spartobacteria bacterium]